MLPWSKPSCLLSPHHLSSLAVLASALGIPHLTIFIFGHSKYFWVLQAYHALSPSGPSYDIYIFFLLRTFFLFSPPLKNSCSFFRSEIQSTSWWLLLWMPQVWQRCFSHDLCPIVSSGQELPCAIIAWIFVSTLDGHFCEDRSMSSVLKSFVQC